MTNTEIVDIYLSKMGYRRTSGTSLEPVLPFIMMDAQFQIFCKTIKPMNCKYALKKHKRTWFDCYHKFNKQFFGAFNAEQQDEIIDKMDDFEEYISQDIENARVAILDVISEYDEDTKMVLSSCLLCNILCQAAQVVWKRVYMTSLHREGFNVDIFGVQQASTRFMHEFYRYADDIDCNQDSKVTEMVDKLCRKMVNWLNEK